MFVVFHVGQHDLNYTSNRYCYTMCSCQLYALYLNSPVPCSQTSCSPNKQPSAEVDRHAYASDTHRNSSPYNYRRLHSFLNNSLVMNDHSHRIHNMHAWMDKSHIPTPDPMRQFDRDTQHVSHRHTARCPIHGRLLDTYSRNAYSHPLYKRGHLPHLRRCRYAPHKHHNRARGTPTCCTGITVGGVVYRHSSFRRRAIAGLCLGCQLPGSINFWGPIFSTYCPLIIIPPIRMRMIIILCIRPVSISTGCMGSFLHFNGIVTDVTYLIFLRMVFNLIIINRNKV